MPSIFEAVLLGLIQGITEWLPISSSGHLAIVQHLMGLEIPVVFDVFLHVGSLLVILMVFRKDILELLKGVIRLDRQSLRYCAMLALSSIPLALAAYFFNDFIKAAFSSTKIVGISLIITAVILLLSRFSLKKNARLGFSASLLIGILQAFALFPGISRSGATISAGMILGIKREEAAKFSFFMAIPAIVGAAVFEAKELTSIESPFILIVAMLVTVAAGYLSLKLLLRIIKMGRFSYFAVYCLAVGIFALVL